MANQLPAGIADKDEAFDIQFKRSLGYAVYGGQNFVSAFLSLIRSKPGIIQVGITLGAPLVSASILRLKMNS